VNEIEITIKHCKPAELIPYAHNARRHSGEQIAQLMDSIAEFGFTNPVLTDGGRGVIAGHGRLIAAQRLGLETVPVIELAHLSENQKRAYILADNRLAELAGWDDDLLREELLHLRQDDPDLLGLVGFAQAELDALFANDVSEAAFPDLPDGDKSPFQQMTFIVHEAQAPTVHDALARAKRDQTEAPGENKNSNGNALYRICAAYLAR